ncbi:MAG: anti-sigma factor [Marmoricola sp.]
MTAHPDLAALLRGELANTPALQAAAHTRSCRSCQDDLVDLALGHGMLTSAVRTLGRGPQPEPALPVTRVPAAPAPVLRAPRRRRTVAAVVAAVLALGATAGGIVLNQDEQRPRDPAAAERTATLAPVEPGAPGPSGTVSMATDTDLVTRMRVDTVDLPRPPRGGFYYVWLFDPVSNKMLPLGQVVPGHRASFDVPASLVEAYSAIDVSLEADDGDPAHSVTSVLRASYDATEPAPQVPSGSS